MVAAFGVKQPSDARTRCHYVHGLDAPVFVPAAIGGHVKTGGYAVGLSSVEPFGPSKPRTIYDLAECQWRPIIAAILANDEETTERLCKEAGIRWEGYPATPVELESGLFITSEGFVRGQRSAEDPSRIVPTDGSR